MKNCSASIRQNPATDTITFLVEVSDCSYSSGTFDIEVAILGSNGELQKLSQTLGWGPTSDQAAVEVEARFELGEGESIGAVSVSNISCECLTASRTSRPPYIFTNKNPPRLKDFDSLLDVPSESLSFAVGVGSWEDIREVFHQDGRDGWHTKPVKWFEQIRTSYTLSRRYRWILDHEYYHHYIGGEVATIRDTTGYDRTVADKFERTLSIGLSASVPFGGLKADVRAALKIDHDTTEVWKEGHETTHQRTFLKPAWHAVWRLCDVLEVSKHQISFILDENRRKIDSRFPTEENSIVQSVSLVFEDKLEDP